MKVVERFGGEWGISLSFAHTFGDCGRKAKPRGTNDEMKSFSALFCVVVVAVVVGLVGCCGSASIAAGDEGRMDQPKPLSGFMKKHGITHEKGWGLRAGELTGFEYPNGTFGVTGNGKLSGFFVMPCMNAGYYDGHPVSMFQTRHYHEQDYTYEIDTTYYLGDADCTPIDSDVYYKTYFHGVIQYHPPSKVIPGALRAELQWTDGTFYVASTFAGRALVNAMNHYCPCGHTWDTGKDEAFKATDCGEKPNIDPSAPRICSIIAGFSDYFNYKWLDDTHYVTSKDCFSSETECYSNPIMDNYIRERIPESGNQNPDSCTYVEWNSCESGIKAAYENCQTCEGLECDGCLFRELNPNWDPTTPGKDYNDWYECCPCIYKFAESYDAAWLKTLC